MGLEEFPNLMGPEDCCILGAALHQERLLYKTDNFFVIPTKGSIGLEGYLLIVPKLHYLGFGMMSESLWPEVEEIVKDVKKLIKSEYGKLVTIFEHGPRLKRESGACIDHAHLHVVPGVDITKAWASDMIGRLNYSGVFYRVDRVSGFERAKILSESEGSYLYMETPDERRLISEQNFDRPRQYFRRMVAAQIGSEEWNWREFPDETIMFKTMDRLAGKF